MNVRGRYTLIIALSIAMISGIMQGQVQFKSPLPGEIYREYIHSMNGNANELQVPDPNLDLNRYPWMAQYIPAPQIPIFIGDLSGAVRAEAVITYIGGHISTVGQKIRWNSNAWIDIPLLDQSNGIPPGHQGYNYLMLHNVTMDIPLDQLFEGTNYFQGTSGTQATPGYSFGWGQWGWYAMMVRIYYGPGKPHATGVITSPAQGAGMNENPVITASITSGSATRVDFLAYYDDYDTDGDGIYLQYHHDYMMVKNQDDLTINNHVGTATGAPWSVTWNTEWVPDQPAGQVKVLARICNSDGIWYVTPEITGLSLVRTERSVKLYKPLDTPERCWAKGDVGPQIIHVNIPSTDVLTDATAARYYIRTWNGENSITEPGDTEYRKFNGWSDSRFGADHHYSLDARTLPLWALQSGTNTFDWFTTNYLHHAIEILWPGPAVAVVYKGGAGPQVPGAASLDSPENGATGVSLTPTLRWHAVMTAASYDVQIARDPQFDSIDQDFTDVTDTNRDAGPLSEETTYFWRVRAKNSAGAGPFSPTWSFQTLSTPLARTILLSPPNGSSDLLTSGVVCAWHATAGATAYHFILGTDSTFSTGIVRDDSTLADTSALVTGLSASTTYYWRVAGMKASGTGPWSSTWSFGTIAAVPGAVTLIAPADRASTVPDSVLVRWSRTSPPSSRYWLQLSQDSTFAGASTVDSTLTDTLKVVRTLTKGTTVFWRVRGGSAGGWGPYSAVRRFTVLLTDVPQRSTVPTTDALMQNYPNPFNPETKITYTVAAGAPKHVRITVHDIFGREITVLVNERKEPGSYSVKWNAAGMASGVYFYRMEAGQFTQTRRLLLVR